MRKVHVLVAGNERGGASSHIITLAKVIVKEQLQSSYVFILIGKGYLFDALGKMDGLCVHVISGRPHIVVKELTTWLKTERPRILHAHGPRVNLIASVVSRQARVPFTTTLHSNIYQDFLGSKLKSILFPKLVLRSLKRAVGAFVVNPFLAELIPNLETEFVPNGIDLHPLEHPRDYYQRQLRTTLGIQNECLLIGTAARFDPVKDLGTMIRALAHPGMESVHLAIAGDGRLRDELFQLTRSLHLDARVHFLGYIDNVKEFYAGLDVHVLTSRSEGTPFSILEAGFYGVPNIGSAIAGITHLLVNHVTGLTFSVGNSSELADAVVRLWQDESLQKHLTESFRGEVLPKFTPESMLHAYESGYAKFLKEVK